MTRIVTTSYRYKRPPPKRKPVALEVPAIVQPKPRKVFGVLREAEVPATANVESFNVGKPAIVTPGKGRAGNDNRHTNDDMPTNDNRAEAGEKSVGANRIPSRIVTVRRRGKRFADVPDMTPQEHQRRGDAANALFRELARRATGPEPTPSSGQEATNVDDPSSRRREARVYLEAWSGVHHRAR